MFKNKGLLISAGESNPLIIFKSCDGFIFKKDSVFINLINNGSIKSNSFLIKFEELALFSKLLLLWINNN